MATELKNLDKEELANLVTSIEDDPDSVASLLFPEYPQGGRAVIRQIGEWAANRRIVLEYTENGNSHIATVFDKICYRCWQQLPAYARKAKVPAFIEK